jgi:asparagine synthase (glutamine-hydrolysing)
MCGIYGGHPSLLQSNADELLFHRGPDQHGSQTFQDRRRSPLVMGMTRLNIVDRRDMPIPFTARGACIVFNGEIYNWREIRAKLEKAGIRFETETDTEVVLHAFLEWGPACLDRFNGMFAFAIWHNGELFLARDRLGKKPVFYCVEGEELAFASELKAFSRLEFVEVDLCERLEFYFDEHTPYRNVKSLKPGEYMIYDTATRRLRLSKWWTYPEYQGTIGDLKKGVSEFLPLFEDACRLRQIADVPVTLFLSGGIDSSLIQAFLKLETTYTVQFPEFKETINEQDLVREYAEFLKFEARMISPTREQFLDLFPYLARYIEFPVGSFSIFPLFCLARQARADGFKVALSGEGADEFFNGYYRNEMLLEENVFLGTYMAGPYKHLATRYFGSDLERQCRMASRNGINDVSLLVKSFAPLWSEGKPFAHNVSVIESCVFLQALLVMADRMSMGNSLEVRNPFMDYRIVEFSTKLVPELRYNHGRGKYILREALKQVLGTDKLGITKRPVKHGLPSPVNAWLFRRNNFERKDWNRIMLGECLRQLTLRAV